MSDYTYNIGVGTRVVWTHKDKRRMGTVQSWPLWSDYAFVAPDEGNGHYIAKSRLQRLDDALVQDDQDREDAIAQLRWAGAHG